jgi:uncharacterized membrane protein
MIEMIVSGITNLMLRVVAVLVWIGMNLFGDFLEKPTKWNVFFIFCNHLVIGILLGLASTFIVKNSLIEDDLLAIANLVAVPAIVGFLVLFSKRVITKKIEYNLEKIYFLLIYTNIFFILCTRLVLI